MGKGKRNKNKNLVIGLPYIDMERLSTLRDNISFDFNFLSRELVALRETNPLIGAYIVLCADDDIKLQQTLTAAYVFLASCGRMPIINQNIYNNFMCNDESLEDTAIINQERLDNQTDIHQHNLAKDLSDGRPDAYMFIMLLFILLEMQCNINLAISKPIIFKPNAVPTKEK